MKVTFFFKVWGVFTSTLWFLHCISKSIYLPHYNQGSSLKVYPKVYARLLVVLNLFLFRGTIPGLWNNFAAHLASFY